MSTTTDLDHALQLRLSTTTVAEIDEVIDAVPLLSDFNRCRFIRIAVRYALDCLREDGYLKKKQSRKTEEEQQ